MKKLLKKVAELEKAKRAEYEKYRPNLKRYNRDELEDYILFLFGVMDEAHEYTFAVTKLESVLTSFIQQSKDINSNSVLWEKYRRFTPVERIDYIIEVLTDSEEGKISPIERYRKIVDATIKTQVGGKGKGANGYKKFLQFVKEQEPLEKGFRPIEHKETTLDNLRIVLKDKGFICDKKTAKTYLVRYLNEMGK